MERADHVRLAARHPLPWGQGSYDSAYNAQEHAHFYLSKNAESLAWKMNFITINISEQTGYMMSEMLHTSPCQREIKKIKNPKHCSISWVLVEEEMLWKMYKI